MNDWICKKCHQYKNVEKEKVKVNDVIQFFGRDSRMKKIILNGLVLRNHRNKKEFIILTKSGAKKVSYENAYLFNAPAEIVYNMFGTCSCSSE